MRNNKTFFIFLFILFNSYTLVLAEQKFDVTGIMQGDEPLAIINDKVFKKGDKIGEAEIIDVGEDFVSFKIKDEIITEHLKKVENNSLKTETQKKALETSVLFKGIQINDVNDINVFRLKSDEECSIEVLNDSKVEPIVAKMVQQEGQIFWVMANFGNVPIELNYFLDEYYLMDKHDKAYKFSVSQISDYPNYLNPNEEWSNHFEGSKSFEINYIKFNEIKFIMCFIGNETRKILLLPCPK